MVLHSRSSSGLTGSSETSILSNSINLAVLIHVKSVKFKLNIDLKKFRILKNNFIDNYRKEKRMVSIEANNIPVMNDGFQEQSVMYQEMLSCLAEFDETDKTILAMLGAGNSYEEIQEVVSDISMANLRVKANRARIRLANCMGKKL